MCSERFQNAGLKHGGFQVSSINEWMCLSPYSTSFPLKPSAATGSSFAPSPPGVRTTATRTGTSVCCVWIYWSVQCPVARTGIAVIHCDIDPTWICYAVLWFSWISTLGIKIYDVSHGPTYPHNLISTWLWSCWNKVHVGCDLFGFPVCIK